ncbi:MAG: signal peptidase I [Candidatus Omnitrophica bacterium]|nr:signal peptidase I [Candidatus Omnitrophota bacterium]
MISPRSHGWLLVGLLLASAVYGLAADRRLVNHSPTGFDTRSETPCRVEAEERTVRGISLEPFIHHGQSVTILRGYYACHPVARGDLVVYRYAGHATPILKVVKAIPGDTFALEPAEDGTGVRLTINGQLAKTSQGIPYTMDERNSRMLALYARDYHGVIPEQAVLILGNQPGGSLDSIRFGLVGQRELLGKAEPSG